MSGPIKKPSRLSLWTGPQSAEAAEPWWRRLSGRDALLRVGLVSATVLALTTLAYLWGLPLPYRIGEVWAHDIRARVDLAVMDEGRTDDAREEAERRLPADRRDDPKAVAQARAAVAPVWQHIRHNEILVHRGERISEDQRNLLREETRAYYRSLGWSQRFQRFSGLLILLGLAAALIASYVVRYHPKLAGNTPQIARVCLLLAGTHLLWLSLARPPLHGGLLPLTVNAMILAIVFRPPFALMVCFSFSIALTASRGNGMDHLLVQVAGQSVAILLMRNVRTRTQLVEIGVMAGLGYALMTVAASLLSGQTRDLTLADCLRRCLWGLLAGFLVTGCLPLIERWFGVVTDIRLLELADAAHPLLQEMVRRAPGTYNHSMTVASLAEQAAEQIGANVLLIRAGAYFHDIGKMLKPAYFIENQSGQNRHDVLEPGLSTLVIIGHVKDGVALAEHHGLPEPVIDFIRQHHGTTLVEYFYRAALRQQEEAGLSAGRGDAGPCKLEASFRYPGPKPQSKETGIVMIADAAESASRALADPTPASLRKLVRDLSMKRLLDGQLEDSGLTLTELHQVEESLAKGLAAVHHARIKYPEPRRAA